MLQQPWHVVGRSAAVLVYVSMMIVIMIIDVIVIADGRGPSSHGSIDGHLLGRLHGHEPMIGMHGRVVLLSEPLLLGERVVQALWLRVHLLHGPDCLHGAAARLMALLGNVMLHRVDRAHRLHGAHCLGGAHRVLDGPHWRGIGRATAAARILLMLLLPASYALLLLLLRVIDVGRAGYVTLYAPI